MPEKDWIVWLDRSCRVEVERRSRGGRVTSFRIVLLADIDGAMHCDTRYDPSHGFAHARHFGFRWTACGQGVA